MNMNMEPDIKPEINREINPDLKTDITKKGHSEKFLRERKFMTMLPLIILPFLVLIFIALKGGTAAGNTVGVKDKGGINTNLPGPNLNKRKDKDKMGVYEDASKDSLKLHEQMNNDPYYSLDKRIPPAFSRLQTISGNRSADSNEAQVLKKLEQLKKVLNGKSAVRSSTLLSSAGSNGISINNSSNNSHKLQHMMDMISTQNAEPDPQVNQLNTMLDKVMLIQHPEKMQDSMKRLSAKNKMLTYVVTSASTPENEITLLDTMDENIQIANAFYGLNDDGQTASEKQNAIEAVIPELQTLVSGATVKLMLLDDIYVNGVKIPKNEPVYGTASLSGERLKISVASIRYLQSILPVSLEVYDLDGMPGIYIPGSINRDVGKQSADNAISTLGLNPVEESVEAQATLAGIEAAKTLASRKIKLIRVTIKSGYRVLLKNASQ
jgi:conjugative transposon TraM protein